VVIAGPTSEYVCTPSTCNSVICQAVKCVEGIKKQCGHCCTHSMPTAGMVAEHCFTHAFDN